MMKTKLLMAWLWLKAIVIWTKLTFHNSWGIINVFNIVWLRPMKGGLLSEDHPMVTGIDPETKETIWKKNIIYQSPRSEDLNNAPSDEDIINIVGTHLSLMVKKSAARESHPFGKPDRMPPAINYIHGSVHYNGGFLIFNDFKDAISHFTNKEFQESFIRFVNEEKREPVTVFRNKEYEREEFLEFVCFLRTIFPWFSNSNGNKKRIGWGNPAPYPAVNTITGHWMTDTYKIYTPEGRKTVCRPPIAKKYFLKPLYVGPRDYTLPMEKYLARFTDKRVLARGEKGNLFFVDLREIKKGFLFDPSKELPSIVDRFKEKVTGM